MRKALDELPTDLYAAYDSALERIRANGPEVEEVVLKGLSLLMFASRALSVSEMQEALSVEPWSTARDPDNVLEFELLLEYFSGLVVLEGDGVQFVHYTVREFLSKRKEVIPSPIYLAKVCLTYALFDEFATGPICSSKEQLYNERLEKFPLLEYVAHNWAVCATDPPEDAKEEIHQSIRKLLASSSNMDSLLQVRYAVKRKEGWWIDGYPRKSSPLHVVARAGLSSLAEQLIRENPGVEYLCLEDSNGRIPLHEAIETGQFVLLPSLLGDSPLPARVRDKEGMTALHHAAVTGNQTAMRKLLEAGAEISVEDRYNRTPLERAMQDSGQDDAAKALLEALIEVGGEDLFTSIGFHGYSALHIAAILGYNSGIRQLLNIGFTAEMRDRYDFTPLHMAAEYGHLEAVKLLLEVSEGKLLYGGDLRTPAHLAAFQGYDEVIDLLLDADKVACLSADDGGLTPLHWAAFGGHLSVVKKLLPLTTSAFEGRNPTHLAMWGGHKDTVEYLRSMSPNFQKASESNLDTVFSLKGLESIAKGRGWYPSAGGGNFDASFLLREAGRSHLRRKQFDLASICFELSTLIYEDNFIEPIPDTVNLIHPEKYCNRCITLPINGTCYTCARCNFGPFMYDLCSECFERRWQFTHIHDHYIPIPSSGELPTIQSLLDALKAAVR
jgi:ankyrin repeat protein